MSLSAPHVCSTFNTLQYENTTCRDVPDVVAQMSILLRIAGQSEEGVCKKRVNLAVLRYGCHAMVAHAWRAWAGFDCMVGHVEDSDHVCPLYRMQNST